MVIPPHNDCTSEGTVGSEEISQTCTQDPQEYRYLVINTNLKKISQRNPRDQETLINRIIIFSPATRGMDNLKIKTSPTTQDAEPHCSVTLEGKVLERKPQRYHYHSVPWICVIEEQMSTESRTC